MVVNIPIELEPYLGTFGPQVYDSWCDEPVGWGYKIIRHCGDEIWSKLLVLGEPVCFNDGDWVLITKSLTRKEAETQYGPVTDEEFGPRGGWKSVTFGDKKFTSKCLKPER